MGFSALLASADRTALHHLGAVVGYTTGQGEAVEVEGIFDSAYVLVDAGNAGVGSFSPAVFLRLSDLPSNPSEDEPSVEVEGVAYRVRESKTDGMGGVVLVLQEI